MSSKRAGTGGGTQWKDLLLGDVGIELDGLMASMLIMVRSSAGIRSRSVGSWRLFCCVVVYYQCRVVDVGRY